MNGEQRPEWYFMHVQDDLNLCMFEDTFSLDVSNILIFILISPQKHVVGTLMNIHNIYFRGEIRKKEIYMDNSLI